MANNFAPAMDRAANHAIAGLSRLANDGMIARWGAPGGQRYPLSINNEAPLHDTRMKCLMM